MLTSTTTGCGWRPMRSAAPRNVPRRRPGGDRVPAVGRPGDHGGADRGPRAGAAGAPMSGPAGTGPTVESVTGPIGPEEMGLTLPHEHVFINMTPTEPRDGFMT